MKILSLVILATIASCAPTKDQSSSQKKYVSITLTDTKHGSGGGGTRAINFDNKPIKFQSGGTNYNAEEAYRLTDPSPAGFTLVYDVTITRRSLSRPKRYQGSMNIAYAEGPANTVLAPDFTLGVMTE